MSINHEVVYGNMLEKNVLPPDALKSVVRIQGEFRGQKSAFGISEEVLSKHILLVGGTGSGKTNLFYHMVRQLKAKMTADDVMLIFDSKGDFHKKFFSKGDVLIGNSAQYRKQSDKWNIYEEIIADGKDYVSISQNTQEICKSLFSELVEKNSSNPFFPIAARDLMASIIIALIRNGVIPNNRDIKEYIDSTSVDDLRELLGQHRELASVASYIGSKSGSQAQGVLSEMYSVVRDVFTGVFADVGDFSMRKFIRQKQGKTAFIEYDLAIGDVLSPRPEDIEQILVLTNAVADKHGRARPDILAEHPYHITQKKLERNMLSDNHRLIVADEGTKIIGVILCSIRSYVGDIKYRNARVISIEDTYVDTDFRRKGIGRIMLDYIKELAKRIGCSRLESNVWAFNRESEKFFEANGFDIQKMTMECSIDE